MESKDFKVGFVASCFDLLHAGHCLFLKEAKENCDFLIAALQSNPNLDRPEKRKPIQTLEERRIQLESCRFVDKIFIYDTEESLSNLLKSIKPDVRFLGSDCKNRDWLTGKEYCNKIFYHERNHNWSSTELINRIKNA